MTSKNAVEWHTAIATDFDAGYDRSDNFKERFKVFSGLIDKYSGSDKAVIDLGCGAGVFSLYAAPLNRHVTGIDGSDAMIAIGKNKADTRNQKNVEFMVRDITTLAKADGLSADLVICSSVLEYIDCIDKSVAVLDLLLKKGGILIVSMPNKSSIYRNLEGLAFSLLKRPKYYRFVKNIVTSEEMCGLLEKLSFDVVEVHYFSSSPLISKILSSHYLRRWTKNLFVIVAIKNNTSEIV